VLLALLIPWGIGFWTLAEYKGNAAFMAFVAFILLGAALALLMKPSDWEM
jgi:phosphotransferase system  glucose/maltose/N-acetylglucosamine-specific IIC component